MLKWRCDANTSSGTSKRHSFGVNMASSVPDIADVSSAEQRSSLPSSLFDTDGSQKEGDSREGSERNSACSVGPSSSIELSCQWSDREETVSAFLSDANRLPCVAKLERAESVPSGLRPYAEQPLLLFTSLRRRQARARSIYHDQRGAYYEVGQTLLIPDDYTGWFELVPPDFSRASCFHSITELANAMPRKFFTRSNLKALRVEQGENGEQKFLERKIPAGSFLRTVSVFTARWRTTAETGVFKKKQKEFVTEEVKYLKCLDADEKEIMIALSHRGKFNAIYEKGKLNQHSVYTMKDILSDLKLPIKVRLLYGKAPVVPCIFTGMLCVRHAQDGDVILASTILNRRNVLLQIPVTVETSDENARLWKEKDPSCQQEMRLRQSAQEDEFADLPAFADASKLCRKYALLYSTLIKLAPEQDTDQKTIQHVPTAQDGQRRGAKGPKGAPETLRTLDLITDISTRRGSEPRDLFLGETDTDSLHSDEQGVLPPTGSCVEFSLFEGGVSDTHA